MSAINWTDQAWCFLADPQGLTLDGEPRRIAVGVDVDLFAPKIANEEIDRVFAAMALCPQHTFQVLTKRPERMAEYLEGIMHQSVSRLGNGVAGAKVMIWPRFYKVIERWLDQGCPGPRVTGDPGDDPIHPDDCFFKTEAAWDRAHNVAGNALDPKAWPLPNVWLGTSVEDQEQADARVPHLLRCPAAVRFLSCDPLLGPVDLLIDGECSSWRCPNCGSRRVDPDYAIEDDHSSWSCHDCLAYGEPGSDARWCSDLDWVIVGGESGPHARACDVAWVRSVVRQCRDAGVPVFVKQLGAMPGIRAEQTVGGRTYSDLYVRGCGFWPSDDEYADANTWILRVTDPKGGDPAEWPDDLRIREFPREREAAGS